MQDPQNRGPYGSERLGTTIYCRKGSRVSAQTVRLNPMCSESLYSQLCLCCSLARRATRSLSNFSISRDPWAKSQASEKCSLARVKESVELQSGLNRTRPLFSWSPTDLVRETDRGPPVHKLPSTPSPCSWSQHAARTSTPFLAANCQCSSGHQF